MSPARSTGTAGQLPHGSSDHALALRASRGDMAALEQLYERYGADVHGVAFNITRSVPDAEDILQEIFASLPEALTSFEPRGSLRAWLRAIAARRSLTLLRQWQRRTRLSGSIPPRRSTPDVLTRIELEMALARLPETLRAVFILREAEGYSHEEIGALLGITAESSATRLHRARRMLRMHLLKDR